MPIVQPNEGLPDILAAILKDKPSGFVDWELMLFVNDITPDQATVYADLTEATFGGYSRETIDHTLWTDPTIIDDHAVSTYTETPIAWTMSSGSGYVYGYALVTVTDPIIIMCERFASPEPITTGRILYLLPRVTQTTEGLV